MVAAFRPVSGEMLVQALSVHGRWERGEGPDVTTGPVSVDINVRVARDLRPARLGTRSIRLATVSRRPIHYLLGSG
jgi:hypothetical protein